MKNDKLKILSPFLDELNPVLTQLNELIDKHKIPHTAISFPFMEGKFSAWINYDSLPETNLE